MSASIKQALYDLCQGYVNERIDASRKAIADAQQSANEETKSSSGDKYETGRAMAQLEIEKNSQQLAEALKLKKALDQIRIDVTPGVVQPGALVKTDRETFFIAIGMGKVSIANETCFVIAPSSPLGQKMLGSRVGSRIVFRDVAYLIQELI